MRVQGLRVWLERARVWVVWSPRNLAIVAGLVVVLVVGSVVAGVVLSRRAGDDGTLVAGPTPEGCRRAVSGWARVYSDQSLTGQEWVDGVTARVTSEAAEPLWVLQPHRDEIPHMFVNARNVEVLPDGTCEAQAVFAGGVAWTVTAVPHADGSWLVSGWHGGE